VLSILPATRILLALQPVDMRLGFNGLYALTQTVLNQQVLSGHLFVFTNKRRNRIRLLFGMARDYGCLRSVWKKEPSAGPRATAPASACALKNCSCFCTVSKAHHGATGTVLELDTFLLDSGFRFATMASMNEALVVQGRRLDPADILHIRELIAANPDWSRRRLSEVLCAEWEWRNGSGRMKDMAARSLLVKLQVRGVIELPPRRQTPSNRMLCRRLSRHNRDTTPVTGALQDLGPLDVQEISTGLRGK